MAYVGDNNWVPANGPKSGPPGPLATRNGMGAIPRANAASIAVLALGLGFAYWVLKPKARRRKRPLARTYSPQDMRMIARTGSAPERRWATAEVARRKRSLKGKYRRRASGR